MADATMRLAMDKSMRRVDQDGRLHVEITNISKANVCEYRGSEIPFAEDLGLSADRVYLLLRDPEELKKAAPTFNNIPLLSRHVPVTADAPRPDLVVGSTGTDAVFEAPYLKNSLVVWDASAITEIESETRKELSCAYHYRADMTPGVYEGETYDGVMRDLKGNHVALVAEGRAGPDVVVGDSALMPIAFIHPPAGAFLMAKPAVVLSRKALLASGALRAYLAPKLAADAKLDLPKVLKGTTAKNWSAAKPMIAQRLLTATKGKLAADASLDDVHTLLDSLDDADPEEVMDGAEPDLKSGEMDPKEKEDNPAVDADPVEKVCKFLEGKIKPEEMAALREMMKAPAEDEDPENETPEEKAARMRKAVADKAAKDAEKDMPTKAAMDAAIAAAVRGATKSAEEATIARLNAVREAERVVRPYVGDLAIAQDTAEGVYRLALDAMGVDVKGVHPDALKPILLAQPKPGQEHKVQRPAMDAAADKSFSERFPGFARIKTI